MAVYKQIGPTLLAILSLYLAGGCVERRMTIRSNPPGALVYVDDYEIGITPVSTSFIYYGTRKIRLVKDGYETLTVMQPVPTPWYEFPPIDLVTENFVPGKLRDQRTLDFQLRPQALVPTDQLLGRAENLRRGTATAAVPYLVPATPPVRINPPPAAPTGSAPPASVSGPAAPPPLGGQPTYPLPQ